MTTLKELDEFAKKYIEQLARDTSRYEKIRTDMRGQVLLDEIKGRIKLVKDALDVFHNDPVAYGNYNFDKYVASLKELKKEYLDTYQKFKAFEAVREIY